MFIAFEGLDCAGKSTLLQRVAQHLKTIGQSFITTREPGGSELGDKLRDLLLWAKGDISSRAELLMYQAARAQHVDMVIAPALKNKKWVLCDRFAASSLAFQQGGRQLSVADVKWLNAFATENRRPDLYVLLDLPVEQSLKRKLQRRSDTGVALDRFEKQDLDFHARVRDSYLQQARDEPARWFVMDATHTPEQLFQQLWAGLKDYNLSLGKRPSVFSARA